MNKLSAPTRIFLGITFLVTVRSEYPAPLQDNTAPDQFNYTNCSIVELKAGDKAFLKERCYSYSNGKEYYHYKCPFTDQYYQVIGEVTGSKSCDYIRFDIACNNDSHFYQACGHGDCHTYIKEYGGELFCSTFVCADNTDKFGVGAGIVFLLINLKIEFCDKEDKEHCLNTDIDETLHDCSSGGKYECCGGGVLLTSKVCDLQCDCGLCDDEGHCNGVSYGIWCRTLQGGDNYYGLPSVICD